jgi:hypothetical protein
MKKSRSKTKHVGSDFDEFLREEGIADEVEAVAIKRVLAWQMQQAMAKSGLTKVEMAKRMKTSRAAVNRLLDAENPAVTLDTITRAANALGASVEVRFQSRAA